MLWMQLSRELCFELFSDLRNFLALDTFNFELKLFPLLLLLYLRLLFCLAKKFFFLTFKLNDPLF